MKIIRPITVTDTALTSSVPEVAPVAYNSGTTYAAGAQVSITSGLVSTVYQSLAGSNTGNAPASSPAWWAVVGDVYAPYSSGATYALGDKATDTTTHRLYESLTASNTGNPLSDATKWLDLGPTTRWAMFDQSNGTATTSGYGIDVTVQTSSRCDGLALLNVDAETVRVTCTVAGTTRTNLFTYSEQFDNAAWTKNAASVTANAGTAPDGMTTADKLIPNTTSNVHGIYSTATFGAGNFTFSVYAKAAGYPRLGMRSYDGAAYVMFATFDLSAGTVVSATGGTATITDEGDGWYRCSVTAYGTNLGAVVGTWIESLPDGVAVQTAFVGDGTSGTLIWGAQMEVGLEATSYLPTEASAVTSDQYTVYDETYSLLSDSGITSWYDWFTEEIVYENDLILTNLPKNSNMAVRVRITSAAGDVSVGSMVLGQQLEIGSVIYGARTGIQDYSRKEADEFGNYNIVQRNFAKRAAFKLVLDNSRIDTVQRILAQYRALPVVWIGADQYSSTWLFGFFKDFAVEIAMIEKSYLTLEIEGLT